MNKLDQFFHLSQRGTTVGKEILGGCTTFCASAYLILVIPNLLAGAGMDVQEVMTASPRPLCGIGATAMRLVALSASASRR